MVKRIKVFMNNSYEYINAFDPEKYKNRRAEMWDGIREWLESDEETQIPDDDYLQADLVSPGFTYTSNTQLLLEPKKDIKKRIGKSPDAGDALALTFAGPVQTQEWAGYDEYDSPTDTVDTVTGY